MVFVATIYRGGLPLIVYEMKDDRTINLDSITTIEMAKSEELKRVRIAICGNYDILRGDLLTPEKYSIKSTKLSPKEANLLRKELAERFKIKGLEGELK